MSRRPPALLSTIAPPSERRIALHLKSDAERAVRQGHPWVYAEAITQQRHEGRAGDLAVIFDRRNRFLAVGLYDPASAIRVRILQRHQQASIDAGWFEGALSAAVRLREPLHNSDTTGYRLVHGENDGLPGLVVDRYEQTLVMKLYTAAWIPHLPVVVEALSAVFPSDRVVVRLSRAMAADPEALQGVTDGAILVGSLLSGPIIFREHGLRFEVDPIHGQKTGFFLDQRDNRARLSRYSEGCRVLDVFAYTGGFAVHAARGGAREVTSIDASKPALEAAKRNMLLNREQPGVSRVRHTTLLGDGFEQLVTLSRQYAQFDVVALDPPAFANTERDIPQALRAYAQLTRLGLTVLRPSGLLMISSCSSHVGAPDFFKTVHRAALDAHRPLRDVARTGHPLDHPIAFREGAYLKCLFAWVEGPPRPAARTPARSSSRATMRHAHRSKPAASPGAARRRRQGGG